MIELITLKRHWFDETTIGQLALDGAAECFMLEDIRRGPGIKVPGKTCIPPGEYTVEITYSHRFKRDLPLVYNVVTPDGRKLVQNEGITFEGIRWHPGNGAEDTEGCQLPGRTRVVNRVLGSVLAFDVLFAKLVLEGPGKKFRFIITDEPNAVISL